MACDESPCFWAHKDFKLPERASEFALRLGRALFFGVLPICSNGRRLFKLARCRRRRWSGCCTLASCRQLAFGLTQLLFNLLQPTNRRPFNLFRLQRFQSWNNLSNYRIDNIHRLILFWRNQVWVRCQCSATASTSIPLSRMHFSNWEQNTDSATVLVVTMPMKRPALKGRKLNSCAPCRHRAAKGTWRGSMPCNVIFSFYSKLSVGWCGTWSIHEAPFHQNGPVSVATAWG